MRGTISYVVALGARGLADPDRVDPPSGAVGGETTTSDTNGAHHDPTSMPSGPFFDAESPGYVIVRALQFTALLVVIGALAFGFVVLGVFQRSESDATVVTSMRTGAATLGVWASLALLATAVLRLYAQSLAIHGPSDALQPSLIGAMVLETMWGWGWLIQIAGALMVVTGFAIARRAHASGWLLAAIAGIALSVAPALSGHAASTPGFTTQAMIADALHIIGAAGWLGSLLFVLVVGIPTAMRLGSERRGATVARLVNAFSPTALVFAGLAIFTGLFAAWLHIGFSSALWTSDYGRMLLIKLAILSVVLGTGAYNWLRARPVLGDDVGTRRMQRSATMELGVGVLVVVVTAILVATPPPMDMDSGAEAAARAPATHE